MRSYLRMFVAVFSIFFFEDARSERFQGLPDNDLWVPVTRDSRTGQRLSSEWDNGYPESSYHRVLNAFYRVYSKKIEALSAN